MSVWTCESCGKTNATPTKVCHCQGDPVEERRALLREEHAKWAELNDQRARRQSVTTTVNLRGWIAEAERDRMGRELTVAQQRIGRQRKTNREQHRALKEANEEIRRLREALEEIKHSTIRYDEGGASDAYEIARDALKEREGE